MKKPTKRVVLTLILDTNYDEGDLDLLIEHVGPDLQRAENDAHLDNDMCDREQDLVLVYQPEGSHWRETQPPYPWCHGNPTRLDCIKRRYCTRNPNCGD